MPSPTKPPLPVDCGWAWCIMLGCFINNYLTIGFIRSQSILLVAFLDKFEGPVAMTTMAFGASEIGESVGSILLPTVLLPRCTVRLLCLGGSVLFGGSLISLAFVNNHILFTVLFGFIGFSRGILINSGIILIGHYFKKRLGLANSIAVSAISVSTVTAPLATQLCLDAYGVQGTLLLLGAVSLNCLVAAILFHPLSMYDAPLSQAVTDDAKNKDHLIGTSTTHSESGKQVAYSSSQEENDGEHAVTLLATTGNHNDHHDKSMVDSSEEDPDNLQLSPSEEEHNNDASKPAKQKNMTFRSVLCNPIALMVIVGTGIGNHTQAGNTFMAVLGKENQVSEYLLPWLLTVTGLCDIVGKLGVGFLSDCGPLWSLHLAIFTQILTGVMFQFTSLYRGTILMFTFASVFGLIGGCIGSLIVPVTVRLVGVDSLSHVWAAFGLLNGGFSSLVQVVVGGLKDNTDSFSSGYNFIGGLILCGAATLCLRPIILRCQSHRQEPEQ